MTVKAADEARTMMELSGRRWVCKARQQSYDPVDCDWPGCGCDPYANKVIESLSESGVLEDHRPRASWWERLVKAITYPSIQKKVDQLMSKFDDLKTALDAIGADVGVIQTGITNLQGQVQSLKDQLAAAGTTLPADAQASLDAAVTEATNIKNAADALAAAVKPADAPPAA